MLIGNIDAFERGKLFGWAFNPQDTSEHLAIRVQAGKEVVAEGIAKLVRPDLPGAGVGAGDHAFELALPSSIKSLDGLVITARSARHGELELSALPNDNQQLNAVLQIYTSRYNSALQILKAQLDEAREQIEQFKLDGIQIEASVPSDVDTRLNGLESRVDSIEVFLLRIDESLRALAEAQRPQRRWSMMRMFS
jgi:hypothetical protein